MAEFTPNYNLKKPGDEDFYNIKDQNDNMNTIDEALTPTADPTQVPAGNGPGKIVQWVSWLTNRIKAITGKANWWDPPTKNMEILADDISILDQDLAALEQAHETHQADIVQTTEVNSSTKYPSAAVTYALQQSLNRKASVNRGVTTTSVTVQASYYDITLVLAGLATNDSIGMFIVSRGLVSAIKPSDRATVTQAADGKITISSIDDTNISYLVLQ